MNRRFWLRLSIIVAIGLGIAIAGVAYLRQQPTELEASVLGYLQLSGDVGSPADVTVLSRLKLYDASSHRIDLLTVCVQDPDGIRLVRMTGMVRGAHDADARWTAVYDSWQPVPRWPDAAEVRAYEAAHQDRLHALLASGYLPRPAAQAAFHARQLLLQVTDAAPGFDPNAGIDAAHLAALMHRDQGDAGRPRLGQFVFAPFHPPRWFRPADGLAAVGGYIDLLETKHERSPDQAERESLERDLKALRIVQQRLEALEQQGGRFYLLARDETP